MSQRSSKINTQEGNNKRIEKQNSKEMKRLSKLFDTNKDSFIFEITKKGSDHYNEYLEWLKTKDDRDTYYDVEKEVGIRAMKYLVSKLSSIYKKSGALDFVRAVEKLDTETREKYYASLSRTKKSKLLKIYNSYFQFQQKLANDATLRKELEHAHQKHFVEHEKIIDSLILRDKNTGQQYIDWLMIIDKKRYEELMKYVQKQIDEQQTENKKKNKKQIAENELNEEQTDKEDKVDEENKEDKGNEEEVDDEQTEDEEEDDEKERKEEEKQEKGIKRTKQIMKKNRKNEKPNEEERQQHETQKQKEEEKFQEQKLTIKSEVPYSQNVNRTKGISKSFRAGLRFPVSRTARYLRKGLYSKRIGEEAPVYLATVLEYITAEILELAGNAAIDDFRQRITARHIFLAIKNDQELEKLCSKTVIASSGVVPNISSSLLPKHRTNQK